ncbi:MAG: argininosuccinate lyase [Christensenellales bacterium]
MNKKLWGGRFRADTDELAADFHSSISFDSRLYRFDIIGSIAHAKMLGETGIISKEDSIAITQGLNFILRDIESGKIEFCAKDEDIHMNIERLLTERIGDAGKRLHTGRSRNDQVCLDMRMYVKQACADIDTRIKALIGVLCGIAERHLFTVMPAYTHMQKAQPTTLAHHMTAYAQMLLRDSARFSYAKDAADMMPLGSGALCATAYPIDRDMVKEALLFKELTPNSMDAVSDRDFALDFIYACAVCAMHLSRLSEEIVLWAAGEFGFIDLSDKYCTGSSIMPQKKNPDMAELIRGKTGRVYGDLISLLTTMKGLPLAYNKDMQEDKEALFDAHDTIAACLTVTAGMIGAASWNTKEMLAAAGLGFTNATDAADYLVNKGLPFRDAHEAVGKLVVYCEQQGKAIGDLSLDELKALSDLFEEDVFERISLKSCIDRREVFGGPNPKSVKKHIETLRKFLE